VLETKQHEIPWIILQAFLLSQIPVALLTNSETPRTWSRVEKWREELEDNVTDNHVLIIRSVHIRKRIFENGSFLF
jgi:hypothetical protein